MKLFKFLTIFLLIFFISFGITSEEIVREVLDTYNKINTFSSILEVYSREGNKEEFFIFEFYFKKPNTYRYNILEGKDKGAVIVIKEGRARMQKPGLLKIVPLTLNLDDPLILNIKKKRYDEMGLGYIIQMITQKPVKLMEEERILGISCFVLEMGSSKDRTHSFLSQKFYIDKNFIPIQLEQYEDYNGIKVLTHRRTYKNYKINPIFDPNIFEI
ncbi:MAG: DUF1571 domain-containing protein [Dictyoglomus sp.]|nr:DUF1571 domain-containing protein [Dictyoglomus sp.]MCX7942446.1 DUF1571 domain-containing protein [Dictyoglomaceae bacterium]MDW8189289.1 DUF1571 domain-containing protein [Dictyoglomus sp.]